MLTNTLRTPNPWIRLSFSFSFLTENYFMIDHLAAYSVLLLVLACFVKLFSISITSEFSLIRISANKVDLGLFGAMDPFFCENLICFGRFFAECNLQKFHFFCFSWETFNQSALNLNAWLRVLRQRTLFTSSDSISLKLSKQSYIQT